MKYPYTYFDLIRIVLIIANFNFHRGTAVVIKEVFIDNEIRPACT